MINEEEGFTWVLNPLWEIEVLTSKQSLQLLDLKQPNELRYYKDRFFLETGKEFKSVVQDKKWSAYLKDDILMLRSWIDMRRMKLIPKKIQKQ
jgi:hypothetical protein